MWLYLWGWVSGSPDLRALEPTPNLNTTFKSSKEQNAENCRDRIPTSLDHLIYYNLTIISILKCSYSSQWEKNIDQELENQDPLGFHHPSAV